MQTALALLPNHFPGIYQEMKGELERQIFEVDFKGWQKQMLEGMSIIEFDELVIGVPPHVRGGLRKNQRNGFYQRNLDTVFGWIEGLKIPRPRVGGFTPTCIGKKYGRRQEALNRLAVECFRRGVSTRDVEKITEALCGVSISAASVSRLTSEWDREVRRWHQRELNDDYVYLMADGIWIKNRSLGKKRRLILVIYGIKLDGTREIIDYTFARSEKEENWLKFLTNLQHRGLKGDNLQLITTDGCGGLTNAIAICFPGVDHQLCWAHKMRNVLKSIRRDDLAKVKAELSPLFKGRWTEKRAMSLINKWIRRWRDIYPKAAHCLGKDLDRLLHYLWCDPSHHQAIRTSNHIERQFREYRRRMRPMDLIPNQPAADRILYAQTMIRNEKLREYPMAFTQKTLH